MNPDGLCAPTVEWRCLKCREIPWGYRDWWTRGEVLEIHHHESFAALEESAALGCYLCRSLRMRLIHRKKPEELTGGPCFLRFEFFDERYQINEFYVGETCIEFYLWKSDDPTVFTAPSNKIKRNSDCPSGVLTAELTGARLCARKLRWRSSEPYPRANQTLD